MAVKKHQNMTEFAGMVLFGTVVGIVICAVIGVIYCGCIILRVMSCRPAPLSENETLFRFGCLVLLR